MNIKEVRDRLNTRANMILKIEQHFKSNKIPIDLTYLDSVDDDMLNGIYEMIKKNKS